MFYKVSIPCENTITIHTEEGTMFQIKQNDTGAFEVFRMEYGMVINSTLVYIADSLSEALLDIEIINRDETSELP